MRRAIEGVNQRLRILKWMKLRRERKWATTHMHAADWPMTVARAAPRMPHPSLKMNIGAIITLTPTERRADTMALRG